MNHITLRRLRDDDSIKELTTLLRRAFGRLDCSGSDGHGSSQTTDIACQRIGQRECLVALAGARIVGSVTLQTAQPQAKIAWYRHPSVASLHQLAVAPAEQGNGIGQALLRAAEVWAFNHRCGALALDVPENAWHLHAYWARQGFSRQSTTQIAGRKHRTAVFSKPVHRVLPLSARTVWPARHPAEPAVRAQQAGHQGHAAARGVQRS